MLAYGEQVAREAGSIGVSLYVEKHNTNATEIYEHLGYAKTPYDIFEQDLVIDRS
jgi:ribosomal protein S18 acetylase RimI-like enzyme